MTSLLDYKAGGKKQRSCRSMVFQPLILAVLLLLGFILPLQAQFKASVNLGATYTDNAFQLSEYDLNRFLNHDAPLSYVKNSDDLMLSTGFRSEYNTHWHWWKIIPYLNGSIEQNTLNTGKHTGDILAGIKVKRLLGELNLAYGYYPYTYLREYVDTDGTRKLEKFSYGKNLYKAEAFVHPSKKSTLNLEFKHEQYYYNKYFTEFDGPANTWTLGWKQSFPVLSLDGSYSYRVFDIANQVSVSQPEDASYESDIYAFGLQLKKMPLDSKYPSLFWSPQFKLKYEERYFQGKDSFHLGRADYIYATTASMQFFPGDRWNFNLDYSYNYRNVDAVSTTVAKLKDYSENRFGVSAGYQF